MKTCHNCGKEIVYNRLWDSATNRYKGGYWAHPITVFNGKSHSIENALMEQRCRTKNEMWATPARVKNGM